MGNRETDPRWGHYCPPGATGRMVVSQGLLRMTRNRASNGSARITGGFGRDVSVQDVRSGNGRDERCMICMISYEGLQFRLRLDVLGGSTNVQHCGSISQHKFTSYPRPSTSTVNLQV